MFKRASISVFVFVEFVVVMLVVFELIFIEVFDKIVGYWCKIFVECFDEEFLMDIMDMNVVFR